MLIVPNADALVLIVFAGIFGGSTFSCGSSHSAAGKLLKLRAEIPQVLFTVFLLIHALVFLTKN